LGDGRRPPIVETSEVTWFKAGQAATIATNTYPPRCRRRDTDAGSLVAKVGIVEGLTQMNKIMRVLGTTTAALALGLGASALPASAAGAAAPASQDWNHSSMNDRHHLKDNNRHDAQHGWWDNEGRWHDWADGSGWRDDNGNWRADNDHNGSWMGRDGFRHDKDGYFDHQGHHHAGRP
jgi:hypothetical protein